MLFRSTMDQVKAILGAGGEAEAEPASGEKKEGFDPVIAEKIKALGTPKAAFPYLLNLSQKV